MTNDEILTGDAMIAFCLEASRGVEESDDTLRGVIARNREVLDAAARSFNPAIGAHSWIGAYEIGYSDEEILTRAGLLIHDDGTSFRRLTREGVALFARPAAD